MSSKYSGTGDKADLDNHANQCNPNHEEYRGHQSGYTGTGTQDDLDNHADQLNPTSDKYQEKGGSKWCPHPPVAQTQHTNDILCSDSLVCEHVKTETYRCGNIVYNYAFIHFLS